MSHQLVLGLFDQAPDAAAAAKGLRGLGIPPERVSIVARTHDEEVDLAQASGATPGSEIEDSPAAARLGELSAHFFAAVALVMPGIGPIVADGPLAAELGEAAGHLAGGVSRTLQRAGMPEADAEQLESRIEQGNLLVGAHVDESAVREVMAVLEQAGASKVLQTSWPDSQEDSSGV
jgi:hypothetical protein